jgi:hypothetical protein
LLQDLRTQTRAETATREPYIGKRLSLARDAARCAALNETVLREDVLFTRILETVRLSPDTGR